MDMTNIESVEPRPSVMLFARMMERTLRKHDAKKGGQKNWRSDDPDDHFNHLEDEIVEARDALTDFRDQGTPMQMDKFISEVVDVANMAMMVADVILQHPAANDSR